MLVFPGINAGASLKPQGSACKPSVRSGRPRHKCRGLIEARFAGFCRSPRHRVFPGINAGASRLSCRTAAMLPAIRTEHDEANTRDVPPGFQGDGGVGGDQRREDAGGTRQAGAGLSRSALRRITLNNAMSITPWPPAVRSRGRFKHGSILGGKTRPERVRSQWESTSPRQASPTDPKSGQPIYRPGFTPPRSAPRRRSSGWVCHRRAHKAHRQLPILKAALAAHGAKHPINPVIERKSPAA